MTRSGYVKPGNWKTTRRRILKRDGERCYLCGGQAQTVDHILNVASGGTHRDDNLAAICIPCHDVKTESERRAGVAKVGRKRPAEAHPGLLVTQKKVGGGADPLPGPRAPRVV